MSGDDLTSNCGTVRFMAPEVAAVDGARTQAYDSKADIFSLAMVYYFVWERARCPASPSATSLLCIWRRSGRGGGRPTAEPRNPSESSSTTCGAWNRRTARRPPTSSTTSTTSSTSRPSAVVC